LYSVVCCWYLCCVMFYNVACEEIMMPLVLILHMTSWNLEQALVRNLCSTWLYV
jgi:hypothetical protein